MTNEDIIYHLNALILHFKANYEHQWNKKDIDVFECIVEKLSNSDEDCISRSEAFETLNSINGTAELDKAFEVIEELPPAIPKPKTGHWIDHQEGRWIYAMCSECGTVHDTQTNYCPNCGAKMESEDKE